MIGVLKFQHDELNWPTWSIQFSPIKMIWSIIKRKLNGKRFQDKEQLFDAILHEWDSLDPEIITNLVSSFKARCEVCELHQGESLNCHWQEVHVLHHWRNPDTMPPSPDFIE
jgi:hypothetical protein